LDGVRRRSARLDRRPRVFFEEWDEPLISGIGWVSELIGIAGGVNVFANLAEGRSAKERI
jgi:iron complex transport system substrate-binding protein